MDYEKKYNEALELARDYYKANLKLDKADENLILEDIFPELAESEGDRIRKEILEVAETVVSCDGTLYGKKYNCREWIAWLEKQGDHKLAWSEEDEQYLLVCKNALAKYQTTDKWDANIIYNWLKNKLQK